MDAQDEWSVTGWQRAWRDEWARCGFAGFTRVGHLVASDVAAQPADSGVSPAGGVDASPTGAAGGVSPQPGRADVPVVAAPERAHEISYGAPASLASADSRVSTQDRYRWFADAFRRHLETLHTANLADQNTTSDDTDDRV